MKTIKGERFILEVESNGDEKFSVFGVSDILYYNASIQRQAQEFFEDTPYEDGNKFNSGERKLKIEVNSEEEKCELSYLFIREGFKIRPQSEEIYWDAECYHYKRRYFTKKYKFRASLSGYLFPYTNEFILYLRKKEVPKFMKFLEILSKQYKYKTVYQDVNQSRNAYRCCNKNDYNYKKKIKT